MVERKREKWIDDLYLVLDQMFAIPAPNDSVSFVESQRFTPFLEAMRERIKEKEGEC